MKTIEEKVVTKITKTVYEVGDVVAMDITRFGTDTHEKTWGVITKVDLNKKDVEYSSFEMIPFQWPMDKDNGELYTMKGFFKDIHEPKDGIFHFKMDYKNWYVN